MKSLTCLCYFCFRHNAFVFIYTYMYHSLIICSKNRFVVYLYMNIHITSLPQVLRIRKQSHMAAGIVYVDGFVFCELDGISHINCFPVENCCKSLLLIFYYHCHIYLLCCCYVEIGQYHVHYVIMVTQSPERILRYIFIMLFIISKCLQVLCKTIRLPWVTSIRMLNIDRNDICVAMKGIVSTLMI